MESVQESVSDAARAMNEASASSGGLASSMDLSEEQTEALEDAVDKLSRAGLKGAAAMRAFRQQVDEAGDEAMTSTGQVAGLSSAMKTVAGLEAGGMFVGTRAPLSSLVAVGTALVGVLGAVGGALGGIAIAGVGAAGALGAIAAVNLKPVIDQMGGMEEATKRFKEELNRAVEPLRSDAFQGMVAGGIETAFEAVNALARSIQAISEPLMATGQAIKDAFGRNAPEILASLENMMVEILPVLENLLIYIADRLPSALQFLTSLTTDLSPALGDLGKAIIRFGVELVRVASIVIQTVAPVIRLIAELISPVLEAFNALPDSLKKATVAFAVAAGGALLMSSYLETLGVSSDIVTKHLSGSLIPTLYSVGKAVWSALGPVAVAIGAIAAAITVFGLWDEIIKIVTSTLGFLGDIVDVVAKAWNGIVEVLERVINLTLGVRDAISRFTPDWLNPILYPLQSLRDLLGLIGDAVDWLASKLVKLAKLAGEDMKSVQDGVKQAVRTLPGGDIAVTAAGAARNLPKSEENGVDLSGAKFGGGGGEESSGKTVKDRTQRIRGRNEYNVNLQVGANQSEDEIKRVVEDAIEEAERKKRRRDGHT